MRERSSVTHHSQRLLATTAAVLRVGAVPLFADIAATGHGIALDHVRQLLQEAGPRPRALIAVHLYG